MGGEAFSKARFELFCEACDRTHRFFHGVHSVEVVVMGKNNKLCSQGLLRKRSRKLAVCSGP